MLSLTLLGVLHHTIKRKILELSSGSNTHFTILYTSYGNRNCWGCDSKDFLPDKMGVTGAFEIATCASPGHTRKKWAKLSHTRMSSRRTSKEGEEQLEQKQNMCLTMSPHTMELLGPQVSLFPNIVSGGFCVPFGNIDIFLQPPVHNLAYMGSGVTF
jgi:hypothetical protein